MIKRTTALISLLFITLLVGVMPSAAQPPRGLEVTCADGGPSFTNGVEFILESFRPGDEVTVTAIGIGDFDPILAMKTSLDANQQAFTCNDDSEDAAQWGADLPTTGPVEPSNLSAQLPIRNRSTDPEVNPEIHMVVGSFGDVDGEFVLVIEGLTLTEEDVEDMGGDPVSVRQTPGMVESDVPLSVYMIAQADQELDPQIWRVEVADQSNVRQYVDENNIPVQCDDAGNVETCWGESIDLSDSFVLLAVEDELIELPGFEYDSMLTLPIELNEDNPRESFIHVLMTSWGQQSLGEYVAVFHASTGPAA